MVKMFFVVHEIRRSHDLLSPWIQVSGSEGRGVANISPMLTITRLHNSVSAVGAMRRCVNLNNHSPLSNQIINNNIVYIFM